jgi:hypothetical protein
VVVHVAGVDVALEPRILHYGGFGLALLLPRDAPADVLVLREDVWPSAPLRGALAIGIFDGHELGNPNGQGIDPVDPFTLELDERARGPFAKILSARVDGGADFLAARPEGERFHAMRRVAPYRGNRAWVTVRVEWRSGGGAPLPEGARALLRRIGESVRYVPGPE